MKGPQGEASARSTRRKAFVLTGVILLLIVAIPVWVFYLGPVLIVRQIHSHRLGTVEWFSRLGVSPNRDAWLIGEVFHCAVASGDSNIVTMMIQRNADINRIDGYGVTPLHVAIRVNDLAMMRLLISHGADASKRDRNGVTPLELANEQKLQEAVPHLERATAQ